MHRIAIVDPDHGSSVVGILTHTTVLSALADSIGVLGELADEPIGRLISTSADAVTTVLESDSLRHCFSVMMSHHFTGLGVVNDAGVLVRAQQPASGS